MVSCWDSLLEVVLYKFAQLLFLVRLITILLWTISPFIAHGRRIAIEEAGTLRLALRFRFGRLESITAITPMNLDPLMVICG